MAERVKTTEEILADLEAFKAACERAREAFQRIDGVVTVGHGVKQIDAKFGNVLAIIVFVKEKKPAASLALAARIPPTFEGYPTDVRVMPVAQLLTCDNNAKYDTIQGGIQIIVAGVQTQAGTQFFAGTLGAIVRRRNHSGRENVYMLSNAHVMYAMGHGRGDSLLHPEPDGSPLGPIQDGGAFRNIVWPPGSSPPNPLPVPGDPGNSANHPHETFIDCAIARLDLDSCCGCTENTTSFTEAIIDINTVTPPGAGRSDAVHDANRIKDVRDVFGDIAFENNTPVKKVGRTTGLTNGICVGVARGFFVKDPFNTTGPQVHAYNCIEIAYAPTPEHPTNCKGRLSFGEEGDSGSLVLDANDKVVGMITTGPPHGAPANEMSTFACHIVPVLDHLGICIPCPAGATGHGSSLATDGSGLGPIPLPPAQSQLSSQISFLADGASAQPPAMMPVPLDGEHGRRMHALLEGFRGTRLGRSLSAVIDDVRRELGYLVRNVRPVKVVWGRHQGPAWLAHFLNHIAGHSSAIPHEIKGVTRRALLVKMRDVLGVYGSNRLKRALDEYGDVVLEMLTSKGNDSLGDVVVWIQERECAQDLERVGAANRVTEEVS